jgi:hypothetical protein
MRTNLTKSITKLAFILILLTTLLTGCVTNGSLPSTQPTTTSEPTHTGTPPQEPIEVEVSFPDGAPPLNQTAELRCTVITHRIPARDMSLDVDLPDVLQLVEGELSWFGDVPADSKVVVIKAVVKAVMVGNGTVDVRSYIDPDKHGGFGGNGWHPVYVSIGVDSSQWRINPSYDAPGTGPPEERPTDLPPPPTTSL